MDMRSAQHIAKNRAASPLAGKELYTRTDYRKILPDAAWSHLAEFNSCYASTQDRPIALDIFPVSVEKLSFWPCPSFIVIDTLVFVVPGHKDEEHIRVCQERSHVVRMHWAARIPGHKWSFCRGIDY
jgi:hypothetical protein